VQDNVAKGYKSFPERWVYMLWWQQLARGVDFTLDKLRWKYTELSEELSDVSNPCIHLNSCCGPEALACCIISFTPPSKVGVRCLVKRMLYSWI
jgi:hypothetical protein